MLSVDTSIFVSFKNQSEMDEDDNPSSSPWSVFHHSSGDHLTLLAIFTAFISNGKSEKWCASHSLNYRGLLSVCSIHDQLLHLASEHPIASRRSEENLETRILKSIVAGFKHSIAISQPHDESFKMIKAVPCTGFIHPSSSLFGKLKRRKKILEGEGVCVVYTQLVFTKKTYMRDVSIIDASMISE